MPESRTGRVYLVGAGPGDPGLLTLRGKECLSRADVVIYDYLANRAFLEYARDGAELIYVGKKGGCHTMRQEEISALIVDRAQKGDTVVRLKGGDPFIFGRGGEEAVELAKAGVAFEVVPGVTSAVAVPAYAGIPLTHRDYASTVAFITGHEDPTKDGSDIAWDKLATGAGTLVFLMGVGNLPRIARRLMENGRPPKTPVAVIRRGTVPEQKTVTGTLGDIARRAEEAGMTPPAVIVVGDVVGLRSELAWYEKRPLFGRRIVVTRARAQASGFLRELIRLGADAIQFPTIEVVPPDTWTPLDRAIEALGTYRWLVFTSANGVRYFLARLRELPRDVRDLKGIRIAAIGPGTARALGRIGITPDLMPEEYRAEAVAACFERHEIKNVRILIPRAEQAREVLPERLREMGAHVDVVPAYRTIRTTRDAGPVREMLASGAIDMITFTSPSTVTNFVEMLRDDPQADPSWMSRVTVACIGPITAETARKNGLSVNLVPDAYTIESLTKGIVDYFASR